MCRNGAPDGGCPLCPFFRRVVRRLVDYPTSPKNHTAEKRGTMANSGKCASSQCLWALGSCRSRRRARSTTSTSTPSSARARRGAPKGAGSYSSCFDLVWGRLSMARPTTVLLTIHDDIYSFVAEHSNVYCHWNFRTFGRILILGCIMLLCAGYK